MSAAIAAATYSDPRRLGEAGEVGDQVVFVLVLVEVQDAVVGCGLLLERDLDLVGCFGGDEVALCVCHALWTPIAAGSPYGYYGMQYAVRPHGRRGNKTQYTRGSTHGIVVPKVSPAHL